jgi:hypothetical protein
MDKLEFPGWREADSYLAKASLNVKTALVESI